MCEEKAEKPQDLQRGSKVGGQSGGGRSEGALSLARTHTHFTAPMKANVNNAVMQLVHFSSLNVLLLL